ncbi:hypothetical protein ACFOU2_03990 [Bacillus songklensis]|uniref:Uncharacterized protein n=1 Tax=Bacillus songklensis TaxID=1069116 RepID=A0ABV8AZH7_9BACI
MLEEVWNTFLIQLQRHPHVRTCTKKVIAGIPFIYIEFALPDTPQLKIDEAIAASSKQAIQGKSITFDTVFVRSEKNLLIYRHRFYVPQQKMFCCGNVCSDCTRFKQ